MRRLLVLVPVLLTAACGSAAVAPLPFDPAVAAPTASAPSVVASTSVPATRTTAPPRRAPPTGTSACLGAVVYTLTAKTVLALVRSLCVATGAILRVEDTGPGTVSAEPTASVALVYEAGIVECRFLVTGTVTVSIERDGEVFDIAVVVK